MASSKADQEGKAKESASEKTKLCQGGEPALSIQAVRELAWTRTLEEVNSAQRERMQTVCKLCNALQSKEFELPPRDPLFLYRHLKIDTDCSRAALGDALFIFGMHLVDVTVHTVEEIRRLNRRDGDVVHQNVETIANKVRFSSSYMKYSASLFIPGWRTFQVENHAAWIKYNVTRIDEVFEMSPPSWPIFNLTLNASHWHVEALKSLLTTMKRRVDQFRQPELKTTNTFARVPLAASLLPPSVRVTGNKSEKQHRLLV